MTPTPPLLSSQIDTVENAKVAEQASPLPCIAKFLWQVYALPVYCRQARSYFDGLAS
jgi:hypothetical protein